MDTKKLSGLLVGLTLVVAVAAVVAIVLRLDRQMINTVVLILVVGIVIALIIAATALPLHARKPERPHEREIIREKHTIDGRVAETPKVHVVQPSNFPMMYPDMLRAAYLSGQAKPAQLIEGEAKTTEAEEWSGPIYVDDARQT